MICPLPVNNYLTEMVRDYKEISVKGNILTDLGYERENYFVPTEVRGYDPATGWLMFWRLKKGKKVVFEMVSDTYLDPPISVYLFPIFSGFIIIFISIKSRKMKINP